MRKGKITATIEEIKEEALYSFCQPEQKIFIIEIGDESDYFSFMTELGGNRHYIKKDMVHLEPEEFSVFKDIFIDVMGDIYDIDDINEFYETYNKTYLSFGNAKEWIVDFFNKNK